MLNMVSSFRLSFHEWAFEIVIHDSAVLRMRAAVY